MRVLAARVGAIVDGDLVVIPTVHNTEVLK
jgi:hypothetical protein